MKQLHKGQLVVCVDCTTMVGRDADMELEKGKVYTIRWVGIFDHPEHGLIHTVRLVEILRGQDQWAPQYADIPFLSWRFKPLDERRLDIFRGHRTLVGVG